MSSFNDHWGLKDTLPPCVGPEPGASAEEPQAGTKSAEALVSGRGGCLGASLASP